MFIDFRGQCGTISRLIRTIRIVVPCWRIIVLMQMYSRTFSERKAGSAGLPYTKKILCLPISIAITESPGELPFIPACDQDHCHSERGERAERVNEVEESSASGGSWRKGNGFHPKRAANCAGGRGNIPNRFSPCLDREHKSLFAVFVPLLRGTAGRGRFLDFVHSLRSLTSLGMTAS